MKKISALLFVLLSINLTFLANAQENEGKAEIVVAKVHADWCGACQILDPSFIKLKESFINDAVIFVIFDRTDEKSTQKSAQIAAELNLKDAFAYHEKTGKILVFNAQTGELLNTFDKNSIIDKMRAFIRKSLG